MIILPTNLTRRYRYKLVSAFSLGRWEHSYEIVGGLGGAHLHFSGPHKIGEREERWSAGLELHSRAPLDEGPPSHDRCWLLECPCWHDGTSLYAEEHFLPMFLDGDHYRIFLGMIGWADDKLKREPQL
jgi:hypothetical protein